MTANLLRQLACFSTRYEAMLEEERKRLGLMCWDELRSDWWSGLRFFLNRAFYQGRRDAVSSRFREAADKALETLLGGETDSTAKASRLLRLSAAGWLLRDRWHDPANPARQALDQKYPVTANGRAESWSTGKGRDREMVLDTLRFVTGHPASPSGVLNLTDYSARCIEEGEVARIHGELQGLRQIGPKVAAVFLRDLVAVLELRPHLRPADYCLLQPVDTWIRQVAKRLAIAPTQDGLAAACHEAGVDPIRFDQGAWYLGAHAFNVLLENLDRIKP